jgi:hypothetical protein
MTYRQIRGLEARAKLEKYLKKLVQMFPGSTSDDLFKMFQIDYQGYSKCTLEGGLKSLSQKKCIKAIRAGRHIRYEPKRLSKVTMTGLKGEPEVVILNPVKLAQEYKGPVPDPVQQETKVTETTQIVNLRVRISVELV